MIENFEEITYELTEEEEQLIPGFVNSFKKRIGKENAITSKQIIQKYAKAGVSIDGPRIRKIINYLRVNYLVPGLMATSAGYYVSTDIKEIESYVRSLAHREAAIATVRLRMEHYIKQLKSKKNESENQS